MAHFGAPDLAGLMHGVAGLRDVPHAAAPASLLAAAAARATCVIATFTPKARSALLGAPLAHAGRLQDTRPIGLQI